MGIRNYLDAIDWETVQKVGKQPWSGWARSKPLVVGNGLFSTAPELTGKNAENQRETQKQNTQKQA